MKNIYALLSRLFSIQPGEEQKTSLLFSMYLIFFLGLMWGDAARETMFLSSWPAENLAQLFIANAILAFLMGLAYTFFADRLSNEKMLEIIYSSMILWLLSVWLLLQFSSGPGSWTYPYFYVAYGAFRNLSTVHILAFINDFYDTRSAKRAIPFILSAGIAGAMLAGFTTVILGRTIGLNNVPLAWIVTIAVCYALLVMIRRRLAADIARIEKSHAHIRNNLNTSGLQNLRQGLRDIINSGLLRWLAFASFLMVFLMNLLIFQSSQVFARVFADNPRGMFEFYGLMSGVSNIVGLVSQSIALSRLIAWLGVGTMNIIFPVLTLGAVIGITVFSGLPTAIFARLNNILFRYALRNPLDAMLYNSIPIEIKSRARGFINGVVTPAGVLVSGLVMLFAGEPGFVGVIVTIIGLAAASLYVVSMMQVRVEYAKSMTGLLAGEEQMLARLAETGAEQFDPAALNSLRTYLLESQDDNRTIILTKVLYDAEGDSAIPFLLEHIPQRSQFALLGVLDTVEVSGLERLEYRTLCLNCLHNPDSQIRLSAAEMLLAWPGLTKDSGKPKLVRQALLDIINDLPLALKEKLVALLLEHGTEEQKLQTSRQLQLWLSKPEISAIPHPTPQGFAVLAQLQHASIQERLQPYLKGEDPLKRRQALATIAILLREDSRQYRNPWVRESIDQLLNDPEYTIRLAAIIELTPPLNARERWNLVAERFADPVFEVRKYACEVSVNPPQRELLRMLDKRDPYTTSSAAFLLTRNGDQRAYARLVQVIQGRIRDACWLVLETSPFQPFQSPGAALVRASFSEESQRIVNEIFWLLGAFSSEEQIQAVQRSLQSKDRFVRANAVEALDALLPPNLARLTTMLADGTQVSTLSRAARTEFNLEPPDLETVLARVWPAAVPGKATSPPPPQLTNIYTDGWLTASAMYTLIEAHETLPAAVLSAIQAPERQTLVRAMTVSLNNSSLAVRQVAQLGLEKLTKSSNPSPKRNSYAHFD